MRLMRTGDTGSASRVVAADRDRLYRLIADVTRYGEWSPENRGARWLGGDTGAAPGARFRGRNRWRLTLWFRTCVVEEAVAGQRFSFVTLPTRGTPDSTRWTYELQDAPGGTRVTESYEIVRPLPEWMQRWLIRRLMPHHFDLRPHLEATLAGLAAAAGILPGQAAAPPGPVDLIGMYVMHHAFRRDLADFTAAVSRTRVGDRRTWTALRDRWDRFAHVLHQHHLAEDEGLWPLLRARVTAAGDPAGPTTLDAMAAEHQEIDPLLEAIRAGFAGMPAAGTDADRAVLADRLREAAARLDHHLGHEERDAMALVQTHLTPADWNRVEKEHFQAAYGLRDLSFVVPWAMWRLPAAARRRALAAGGPPLTVLWRLTAPGFRRRERATFADAAPVSSARVEGSSAPTDLRVEAPRA